MNRTGTTFLQQEVFPKLENVEYIPRYIDKVAIYARHPISMSFPDIDKPILVSNEGFSLFTQVEGLHSKYCAKPEVIAKRLHRVFPQARIILGIRDKDSWLFSTYKNLVRHGYDKSFNYFLENVRDFDIKSLKDTVISLFDEVYIYSFDEFKKNNKKVIADMASSRNYFLN